jgi:hypothetical protein
MQDALIIAKNGGVDVFNALDLMGSAEMLSDLKFGPGDGALQCVHSHATRQCQTNPLLQILCL